MDGCTSPGRFLAYLLAEHDLTVKSFCLKSGLAQREVWVSAVRPQTGYAGYCGKARARFLLSRVLEYQAGHVAAPA